MNNAIEKCRLCGNNNLTNILDLGSQVIANHFHKKEEPNSLGIPLHLIRCKTCSLVQLNNIIDTDIMYKNYWYQSGINETMRNHLKDISNKILQSMSFEKDDIAIDIGCNDGTFLEYLPTCTKIGVDPSNIKPSNCIFVNNYFNVSSVSPYLKNNKAKLITSIAMFYDLNDPKSFVKDIRASLRDNGLWVAELSYLPRMLQNRAYDSICHEHVVYYRLGTFAKTLEGTDLRIVHAEINNINGSSFRIFITPSSNMKPTDNFLRLVEEEEKTNYFEDIVYDDFSNNINVESKRLIEALESFKDKKVYGYGASTKGQIIMQYCGITAEHLKGIAERNPRKYDLYTPGTNVLICSEEEMRKDNPDYLVVFPWYFFDEFKKRENLLHEQGCRFILPLPKMEII